MGEVVAGILPLTIGIALSPEAILLVIVILSADHPGTKGFLFITGWLLGLAALAALLFYIFGTRGALPEDPKKGIFVVRLVAGLLLLYMSYRFARQAPRAGEIPAMPKRARIRLPVNHFKALWYGFLRALVGLRTIVLTLSAVVIVSRAPISTRDAAIALGVFVIFSSVLVLAPLVLHFLRGDKASTPLSFWKDWATANNTTVMAVLLFVLGIVQVASGIGGLLT